MHSPLCEVSALLPSRLGDGRLFLLAGSEALRLRRWDLPAIAVGATSEVGDQWPSLVLGLARLLSRLRFRCKRLVALHHFNNCNY